MIRKFIVPLIFLLSASGYAAAEPKVVVSIKPIHSIVSAVMAGAGQPDLLMDGLASPHSYNLKPSEAGKLQDADIVFWVGHELEAFLEKPLSTVASDAIVVSLIDTPGLTRLDFREGEGFGAHDDAPDHEHDHADEAEKAGSDEHAEGMDPHIWLDPENAKVLADNIASKLSEKDAVNADRYQQNAIVFAAEMDALQSELQATLGPVRGKPFAVFHDAYHYFEARFGIEAVTAITLNAQVNPGAAHIRDVREEIDEANVVCVFSEPQFSAKLIDTVTEGTSVRHAVLDPLGSGIDAGPQQYPALLRELGTALRDCLAETG